MMICVIFLEKILMNMALECLPRPSYGNKSAYTHTFESPDHKIARAIVASNVDFFRAVSKMAPQVAHTPTVFLLFDWWFFGLMRLKFIHTPEEFAVVRADLLQTLMPRMRETFADFNFVYNHNFREIINLVDNGLGMVRDWMAHNCNQCEHHHQLAKRNAAQGLGVPLINIHTLHNKLMDAATLALDVSLETEGRIAPTRDLRHQRAVYASFFQKDRVTSGSGPETYDFSKINRMFRSQAQNYTIFPGKT